LVPKDTPITPAPRDLVIVGGGVNGCGIARDAAGRGLTVTLVEADDLARGTSSASTKLIHGGLRYLEHYEFRLVRHALQEREVLWGIAPHLISPMRFILPHHPGLRPAWLLRLGLLLYDTLGGRKRLPGTRTVDFTCDPVGGFLKPELRRGFEYSDCWVDDARLVVLNARDAADRGAEIATRTRFVGAERRGDQWVVALEDVRTGVRRTLETRALVLAAGPWIDQTLAQLRVNAPAHVRLVQGSHIVLNRPMPDARAFIFQTSDQRIVFAIPYEGDLTMVGTTDLDFTGDPATAAASEAEVDYLLGTLNLYLRQPASRSDIVWSFSGVRPLYDDGASEARAATRDYVLKLDAPSGAAPLLSIFGGKITTYRRLAEEALAQLAPYFPRADHGSWTGGSALPGGDFPIDGRGALATSLTSGFPFLSAPQAERLVCAYGTRAHRILAAAIRGPGRSFGAGLTEAELDYLMREEWAERAADVVWRRSKLGLRMSPEEIAALDAHMTRLTPAM
jgi:glycerol-3-phosphate dehydrogenase